MSCLLNCIRKPSSEVAYSLVSQEEQDVQEARVSFIGRRVFEAAADHYVITGVVVSASSLVITAITAVMLPAALPAVVGGAFVLMFLYGHGIATFSAEQSADRKRSWLKSDFEAEKAKNKVLQEQLRTTRQDSELKNSTLITALRRLQESATDRTEKTKLGRMIKYFELEAQLHVWCDKAVKDESEDLQNLKNREEIRKRILEAFLMKSPTLDLRSLHGEFTIPIKVLRKYFAKGITIEQNEGDRIFISVKTPHCLQREFDRRFFFIGLMDEIRKYFPKERTVIIKHIDNQIVVEKTKKEIKEIAFEIEGRLNIWCDRAKGLENIESRKKMKKIILDAFLNDPHTLDFRSLRGEFIVPADIIAEYFPVGRTIKQNEGDRLIKGLCILSNFQI